MGKFFLLICLAAVSFQTFAQNKALKFDEFDDSVNNNFFSEKNPITINERVDRFIRQINMERGVSVYIIYYTARKLESVEKHDVANLADSMQYRIRNHTKLKPENIMLINGGLREHNYFEFWIVPKSAEPPRSTPTFEPNEAIVCPFIYATNDRSAFHITKRVRFSILNYPEAPGGLKASWKVSSGTIVEGQGTGSITVDMTNAGAGRITADAKISDLPAGCENVRSTTVDVTETSYMISGGPFYNFSYLSAVVDALLIELQNHPDFSGYVIVYGARSGKPENLTAIVKNIRNALAFRKFDPSRITIVNGGYREEREVDMWLVPPGAKLPLPSPTIDKKFVTPVRKIKKKRVRR